MCTVYYVELLLPRSRMDLLVSLLTELWKENIIFNWLLSVEGEKLQLTGERLNDNHEKGNVFLKTLIFENESANEILLCQWCSFMKITSTCFNRLFVSFLSVHIFLKGHLFSVFYFSFRCYSSICRFWPSRCGFTFNSWFFFLIKFFSFI